MGFSGALFVCPPTKISDMSGIRLTVQLGADHQPWLLFVQVTTADETEMSHAAQIWAKKMDFKASSFCPA